MYTSEIHELITDLEKVIANPEGHYGIMGAQNKYFSRSKYPSPWWVREAIVTALS